MVYNDFVQKLVTENTLQKLNLSIGNRVILRNRPGMIYPFDEAPITKATRKNLMILKHNRDEMGQEVIFDKVYITNVSKQEDRNSYFVTGTLNGKPFIYTRINKYNRNSFGGGPTDFYFQDSDNHVSKLKAAYVRDITKDTVHPTKDGDGNIIYKTSGDSYFKNKELTVFHRLNGPARDKQEYWIDGKQYGNKDRWYLHALIRTKVHNKEDAKSVIDLTKI